jgi:hypothetical protein
MKCLRRLSIVTLTVLASIAFGSVEGRMIEPTKSHLKINVISHNTPLSFKSNIVHPVESTKHQELRGGDGMTSELIHRLKVGFYFSLWYALNVVYNSTCFF